MDMNGMFTLAVLATAIPTFLGIVFAYGLISINLGIFLWTTRSVPNDIGISLTGSGLISLLLIAVFVLYINLR